MFTLNLIKKFLSSQEIEPAHEKAIYFFAELRKQPLRKMNKRIERSL